MKYKQLLQLKHLVLGAVFLGLIFAGLNCGGEREELYNYVPEDVSIIFTLDFQAFIKLDRYKNFYSIWKENLDEQVDEKVDKFLKEADIDLEYDLFKVVFLLYMDAGMKNPKGAAIIKGAYKQEKLISALKNNEVNFKEDNYDDVPLLKIEENKPGKAPVLAFLSPSCLAVGLEAQVQKVIDVSKGKLDSVYANKKMERFLKIEPNTHILAMTFLIPGELKKQKTPLQQMGVDFSRLESFILTLDRESVAFRFLSSPGYEDNKKLADLLNGFKAMAGAREPRTDEEGQMLKMYKESTIKAFENEVRFTMPTDKLLTIISRMAEKNLVTALQNGKQKATMGDMKSIGNAIESYIADAGQAPEGNFLVEIKDKLEPFYIKKLPLKDAWGNDFLYMHGTDDDKDNYAIASPARDGVFNGWKQAGSYVVTTTTGFDRDIVYSNGAFIYGPRTR